MTTTKTMIKRKPPIPPHIISDRSLQLVKQDRSVCSTRPQSQVSLKHSQLHKIRNSKADSKI